VYAADTLFLSQFAHQNHDTPYITEPHHGVYDIFITSNVFATHEVLDTLLIGAQTVHEA
jgi:hypothetical protein